MTKLIGSILACSWGFIFPTFELFSGPGVLAHLLVSLGLMVLFRGLGIGAKEAMIAILILGLMKELSDYHIETMDLVANVIGVCLGAMFSAPQKKELYNGN